MSDLEINLALSGGGIKGICHLGGIKAIEDSGIKIRGIAGASVGGIIAALYGAGYTYQELQEIIFNQNFLVFKDGSWLLINLLRLVSKFGLYKGNKFLSWMTEKLLAKGVKKFKDLKKDVRIISSEVNSKRSKVFSKQNTPNMLIAKAVRMSISIPIVYVPFSYNYNLFVDGGVMNNFPLTVFDESVYPTLGLILADREHKKRKEISNFIDYAAQLIDMMVSVNEQRQIELSNSHVVRIPISNIKVTDFDISKVKREELCQLGYKLVKQHLDRFKDRRLDKNIKLIEYNDVRATTIELEEFSRTMAKYIVKVININEINTIVTINQEDYLFSYLVAQQLKKKFAVVYIEDIKEYNLSNCYRYNRIKEGEKIIIVSLLTLREKELLKLIDKVRKKKGELVGRFTFIDNDHEEEDVNLKKLTIPHYVYQKFKI